jgi:hypothetical protein
MLMRCRPLGRRLSMMDLADSPPHLPPTSTSIPPSSSPAKVGAFDDDLSDSSLSQLEAEIEQGLASASPDTRRVVTNGTTAMAVSPSDDAMEIDSDEEDVKQHRVSSRSKKRLTEREYFDPDLYGLRRSVSPTTINPVLHFDTISFSFVVGN